MTKATIRPLPSLATKMTREGVRSMVNGKPYRTKEQKAQAAKTAYKTEDGHYASGAPVSYHY